MDFGLFPPEVNSARLYAGAGVGPMMAAAGAWSRIAAELSQTALVYQRVISELTSQYWQGATAQRVARAIEPMIEWLDYSARAAEHASSQAMASAAAFEIAFQTIIPPAVVAQNRAQLAGLVATNILGIHSAAIAATEAAYAHMWAHDAAVMYAYASATTQAGTLTPLHDPIEVTTAPSQTGTSPGLAQTSPISSIVSQLTHDLENPWILSPLQMLNNYPLTVDTLQALLAAGADIASWNLFAGIATDVTGASSAALAQATTGISEPTGILASQISASEQSMMPTVSHAESSGTLVRTPPSPLVQASRARAHSIAHLSVPDSWTLNAETDSSIGGLSEGESVLTTSESAQTVEIIPSAVPLSKTSQQGSFGLGTPRYGVKPTIMNRPVLGG